MTAKVRTHPKAEVKRHLGMPTMYVDGQPSAAMCYMTYRPKEDKLRTDLFLFRDPAKSQHVIDTLDFEAELIADTIAYFCRVVKDETQGRAFTGAFYGYLTGADDKGYCATHSLLQCPDLDFLTAPSAYAFREPGCGFSTDRTCLRSVQLHGKLWWDENDYYTYLTPEWKWVEGWTGPRDFRTTEVQQLRQLTNQVVHGMAGWWFDCRPTHAAIRPTNALLPVAD